MKLLNEVVESVSTEILTEGNSKEESIKISGPFIHCNEQNRNGRIYVLEHMMPEVSRYIKEFVDTKRAVGELCHPCFWGNTKALTETGWKYIKDINVGEYVYSLNIENNNIELQEVLKVEIHDYKGEMYKFKNRTFDTVVSPDHKFLLEDRYNNKFYKTAKDIYSEFNTLSHTKIIKTGNCYKENDFNIKFEGQPNSKLYKEDLYLDFYNFCGFLGLYLAEGNTRHTKKQTYQISIYQNEGIKADIIRECLNKLPITFTEKQNGKKIIWSSLDSRLGEYLHKLGICYNKYIPVDILNNLNSDSAAYLLDMFILGDGRGIRTKKFSITDCFSTSEKLIDDLSIVALKAGNAFKLYDFMPTEDTYIDDRLIKAENKSKLYFMQILSSKGIYLDKRHLNIEKIDYNDKIYCLNVANNNNFYALDGGYSFWTGNSGPTINPDRVSHLITKLEWDGNLCMGEARLLDTPTGNILKSFVKEGVKFGVSTRGLGSLKEHNGMKYVQSDFRLVTVDAVLDPSGIACFTEGLLESKDWVYVEGKGWVEQYLEESKKTIQKLKASDVEPVALKIFENFLKRL